MAKRSLNSDARNKADPHAYTPRQDILREPPTEQTAKTDIAAISQQYGENTSTVLPQHKTRTAERDRPKFLLDFEPTDMERLRQVAAEKQMSIRSYARAAVLNALRNEPQA